jgi:hypothetical protein
LPPPDGVAAWREWRDRVELQEIDRGSSRLLPLLWFNLLANGIDDPWLPRIKGVYRHAWFSNQLRVKRLRTVEQVLADAGVELMVLKGIALAFASYPNPGLRPMDDMDLLVRPSDARRALDALGRAGWRAAVAHPERVLRVVHGAELQRGDDRLDLHGHLFQGSLHAGLDARRWARSVLLELADGPLRVLDPTDQLLHVMIHGVESDPPAPRWPADAMMVLRSGRDEIDWGRLAADAEEESRSLALAHAVAQLLRIFGRDRVPVPDAVIAQLRTRGWSGAERLEHRVAARTPLPVVGYLLRRIVDWRRWRRAIPSRRGGLIRYLRLNWGLDSLAHLPLQVVRRGVRAAGEDAIRLAGRIGPGRHG